MEVRDEAGGRTGTAQPVELLGTVNRHASPLAGLVSCFWQPTWIRPYWARDEDGPDNRGGSAKGDGWVNWSGLATLMSTAGQSLEAVLMRLLSQESVLGA